MGIYWFNGIWYGFTMFHGFHLWIDGCSVHGICRFLDIIGSAGASHMRWFILVITGFSDDPSVTLPQGHRKNPTRWFFGGRGKIARQKWLEWEAEIDQFFWFDSWFDSYTFQLKKGQRRTYFECIRIEIRNLNYLFCGSICTWIVSKLWTDHGSKKNQLFMTPVAVSSSRGNFQCVRPHSLILSFHPRYSLLVEKPRTQGRKDATCSTLSLRIYAWFTWFYPFTKISYEGIVTYSQPADWAGKTAELWKLNVISCDFNH